jgi:molybdate transport system substrate-binding protein
MSCARLVVCGLCILQALAGCSSDDRAAAADPEKGPVRVVAAASLREVVTEIASEWTRRTGREVVPSFEATSTLARQIQEGARADLFIAADPEWLDRVHPTERHDWLGNRLVLVVPKDSPDVDLKAARSLALANEQVPAGKHARAALAHLGVPLPARTIHGSSVRDVLAKVSSGGAEAGIVYATDPAVDPGLRVAFTFPPGSHPPIVYATGLLDPRGKAFFAALREPWALAIAARRGFTVLTSP